MSGPAYENLELGANRGLGEMSVRKAMVSVTKRARLMIVSALCVLLLCAVISLAILYAQKDQKYIERKELVVAQKDIEESHLIQKNDSADTNSSKICLTRACIATAYRVDQYMDPDVSPCENFYQFACGGWEKTHEIPYYKEGDWSVANDVTLHSLRFFKEELEKPLATSSYEPDRKARTLYKTCMSVGHDSLSDARKIIDDMGGFSLNLSEPYPDFDLTERLIQLSKLQLYPLLNLSQSLWPTPKEPHRFLLTITPPKGIPQVSFLKKKILWNALVDTDRAPSDASISFEHYTDLTAIENALWRLMINHLFEPELEENITVEVLQTQLPLINWTRLFEGVLTNSPKVIVVSNIFWFAMMENLVDESNVRVLDNTLKFMFAMKYIDYISPVFNEKEDFIQNRGFLHNPDWFPEPRWMYCVGQIKTQYRLLMTQWYANDYFQNEDEVVQDVDMMIKNIRSKYIQILESTELLDNETREFAVEKMKAMKKRVAFPSYIKNRTFIADLYDHMVANASISFFMNIIDSVKANPYSQISRVGKDHDILWSMEAFDTNAFYNLPNNRFTILAGSVQRPYYDLENPKYINYAGLGSTIGHEMTHAFDNTGRHFDLNGSRRNWWSIASEVKYEETVKCYEREYNKLNITAYESNYTRHDNGYLTLDENIADNGGEYVVYQAYEEWMKKNGEEKLLPTPYLDTWQKQYYVSHAQKRCAEYTPRWLEIREDLYTHSLSEARVNGVILNSVRFADAFQCPVGSKMNPKDKCKLW